MGHRRSTRRQILRLGVMTGGGLLAGRSALAAQELKHDQAWQDNQLVRFQQLAKLYGAEGR